MSKKILKDCVVITKEDLDLKRDKFIKIMDEIQSKIKDIKEEYKNIPESK
jgi:hypothetical protein